MSRRLVFAAGFALGVGLLNWLWTVPVERALRREMELVRAEAWAITARAVAVAERAAWTEREGQYLVRRLTRAVP